VRLARLIVRHLPDTLSCDERSAEARLTDALAEAKRRWPDVKVDPETFAGWIATRIAPEAVSVEAGLEGLKLADLYLACACAAGDPKALAAFDASFLTGDSRTSEDVKQALRQKLFVAENGREPRIADYAGRGDLRRWIRAATARMEIDEMRSTREIPTEDALLEAIGIDPGEGGEVALVKRDSKAAFQAAFKEAVETLSDRDRTLLQQYYIDNLGLAALGHLYKINPSNVSRSLAKARAVLLAGIRKSLLKKKKIKADELDSLVNLVRSQLTLTGGFRSR
jgi:RNA polymerase sigma-70 factor (ECF subfamily)